MRKGVFSHEDIVAMFVTAGMDSAVVAEKLGAAKGFEQARAAFAELKVLAKAAWKKKAFDLHPDRGGDEEEFKRVAAVVDELLKVEMVQPRMPPHVMRSVVVPFVQVVINFGGFDNATTGSETTSTGGGWRRW